MDLYCTDPVQQLLTAGYDLDDLDDLDLDLSHVWIFLVFGASLEALKEGVLSRRLTG